MKKALFIISLIFLTMCVYAQEMNFVESDYYEVQSQISWVHAAETGEMLDAYFNFFNSYFHFTPSSLKYKMKVKIFKNKSSFDAYIENIVPDKKDYFVYLQYNNPEKNELVCFYTDTEEYDKFLSHYGFIHFLKTFVKNPPLWLQKGFAIYFENCKYISSNNGVKYIANTEWLYTLKQYISYTAEKSSESIIPLSNLLSMDIEAANKNINIFHAQSWGLVNFLLNSDNKNYNRVIWDSINALSPDEDRKTNEINIFTHAFGWVDKNNLSNDFLTFVKNIKTFADIVQDGIDQYDRSDYTGAEATFKDALTLKQDNSVPYYYLGLIKYNDDNYKMADYYYQTAIQMGGKVAITRYALGVNAYADKRYKESVMELVKCYQSDPDNYGSKALDLISKINKEQPGIVIPVINSMGISQADINIIVNSF